jgi:eukaryotic-like serine/threonine-protein kinase
LVTPTCLDEKTVLAFLDGTLPGAARGEVEAHLASCSACAELVTWAAADIANASRAPGREGQPFVGQLAPGSRVDRYQILGPVGRGGMGEVYAAYHPDLDRRIALKIVYESGAGSAERRARLLGEARTVARLSHPNVITVYDAGTIGERVYIAMEFVDGETLDGWLRGTPRSWQEILEVFVATGRGLAAAHAAGIVHRDFKPQNVMIGKDGSVRVMDFGLARLVGDEIDVGAYAREAREAAAASGDSRPTGARVTKTGALLGTPAYMAPEQWRGEPIDARADQFSFCVALHEALYGVRPALAHITQDPTVATPEGSPERGQSGASSRVRSNAPAWLRNVVLRGLAADREKRFASTDLLLSALTRGRTRAQRRLTGVAVGFAVALLGIGAWRLSPARRFDCKPPAERLAAAWSPNDPSDKRHKSLHAAVLASGHPEAAMIWAQLSSKLDEYVGRWSTMYKETCEATHVRGEQSEEMLDLRMRCLNENLDEVRAMTDVLTTADRATLPREVTAASGLTPVARCADVRVLRAAVPLPRDEKTLQAVLALRSSLKEVQATHDVGRYRAALDKAITLRPKVEATHYKPLMAELLDLTGLIESGFGDPSEGENNLKTSFVLALGVGDDLEAAKSAANLIFLVGYREGRYAESDHWWAVTNALFDRLGSGHEHFRSWAFQNQGEVFMRMGKYEQARDLLQHAVILKEATLGHDDPDVAISLAVLGDALRALGRLQEALDMVDRAATILVGSSDLLDLVLDARGEILLELGRYQEAELTDDRVLKDWETSDAWNWRIAYPLTTLGNIRVATGDSTSAVSYFERALRIRKSMDSDPTLGAETRFGLARALWESGGDRARALSLARSAREAYAPSNRPRQLAEVDAWLAAHAKNVHRPSAQGKVRRQPSDSPPSAAMEATTSSARR